MTNGLWVHQIPRCGGALGVIEKAKAIDASHIIVKSRDGRSAYKKNRGLITSLSVAANMGGLDVWLWTWARPYAPMQGLDYVTDQAKLLAQDARQHRAKVVVCNMESPWSWSKLGGGFLLGESELRRRAYKYLCTLRDSLPNDCQIGISSFRFPEWHRLPWTEMLSSTPVIGMPQLYFERKGYDEQARRAHAEWRSYGVTGIRISGPGYAWKRGKMDPPAFYNESKRHCQGVDWWKADGMKPSDLDDIRDL